MAIVTPNIKQVSLSDGEHYISAKYLLDNLSGEHTYEDIISKIQEGLKIVIDTKHATKEEPATTASASTMGKLYLVQLTGQLSGSYTEFITLELGTTTKTYQWEKIGTTDVDLSNYMKRGVTFNDAALNAGAHTHSVSGSVDVPSITKSSKKLSASATQGTVTPTTKNALGASATFTTTLTPTTTNLKAAASGTAVGADGTASAVTGITPTIKYLLRDSVRGVSGSTTASKATAGTAKTFITAAIKNAALTGTTTFNTNAIKSVALSASATSTDGPQYIQDVTHTAATLTGTKTFNTDAIKSASCSQSFLTAGLASASFTPSVNASGVLSFSFSTTAATPTAVSISTAAASTGTVGISGGSIEKTTKYMKATGTAANTASVGIEVTAADAKDSITPYTFADVTVPIADTYAKSFATGKTATTQPEGGEGTDFVHSVAASGTATVLTGVKVTAQPTITLDIGPSAGIPIMTNISAATTVNTADTVAALTGVSVGNPSVTLAAGSTGDVDVVESMTINTTSASLKSGSAASAGAHTHNVKAAAAE